MSNEHLYDAKVFAFDPSGMTQETSEDAARALFETIEATGKQVLSLGVRRIEFHDNDSKTAMFFGFAQVRDQSPGETLYRLVAERLGNLEWSLLSDYQRGRWEEIANAFKQCV